MNNLQNNICMVRINGKSTLWGLTGHCVQSKQLGSQQDIAGVIVKEVAESVFDFLQER